MSVDKIFVLHEYGEPHHYLALEKAAQERYIKIEYFEFSCIKGLVKALIQKERKKIQKQFKNCLFLFSLLLSKNKKIVLGIAPYDYRLLFLRIFLYSHSIYYHTSWPYWDGTFYPKKRFVNAFVRRQWKKFLQNVKRVASVTKYTKDELQRYIGIEIQKIDVVYHSYDETIFFDRGLQRDIDFLYVGRLVEAKGIKEILDIFAQREEKLLIVGDGPLRSLVERYANEYENIEYLSYRSKEELAFLYNRSRYFILNSKRTKSWEELFGMVLIESMACGCIPLSVDHVGPKEILQDGIYGFLYSEGTLKDVLERKIRQRAIPSSLVQKRAKFFNLQNSKQRWQRVIDE